MTDEEKRFDRREEARLDDMYDAQCDRCGEVNPAEIHTCTPKQPEQEPVAWMYQHEDTGLTMCVIVQQVGAGFEKNNPRWKKITPLYTAPPQREWQGLTDEETENFARALWPRQATAKDFIRAIEAKLKEKNT